MLFSNALWPIKDDEIIASGLSNRVVAIRKSTWKVKQNIWMSFVIPVKSHFLNQQYFDMLPKVNPAKHFMVQDSKR